VDGYIEYFNGTAAGSLDLYTMDHRGTGRSFFLECDAAQAFAATSPEGTEISPSEIPGCFADLSFQIDGHFEAFSVTSAAKDVAFLVEQLTGDGQDVFIYGVSYGTLLTERIMHLAPANVRGYILDGIEPEDNPSFSTTNPNRLHPGQRFAEACEADALCSSYFVDELTQYGNLTTAWLALYDALDSAAPGESACADLIAEGNAYYPYASDFLRSVFENTYIKDQTMRSLVPAILYRLTHCDDFDIPFLRVALGITESFSSAAYDSSSSATYESSSSAAYESSSSDAYESSSSARRLEAYDEVEEVSPLLHWIIKVSEMWTEPTPSWDEDYAIYRSGVFTADMANEFAWYCYMTSDFTSPACSNLLAGSASMDLDALDAVGPFTYETDEYFHKFATIPDNASVLLFNGELDFQTISEGGQTEYENLVGDRKMIVTFQYGVHGTGFQPTTPDDTINCGPSIMAQFVQLGGALDDINTACLDELPAISFNDSYAILSTFGDLTDLYDGEMPADTGGSASLATAAAQRRHRKSYGVYHL
jgi:pimeloyl-ACP methyl ester carboxylesterase